MILRSLLIFALVLLPPALSGCGKKGPPRPLLQKLPAAPRNLDLRQQGRRLILAWSLPKTNQDGSPLTDLQEFRIFKMEYDPQRECPECRDTSVLFATADLDYLRDVRRRGDRLFLRDNLLQAGTGYQYRVVAVNAGGAAGAPAVAKRPYVVPPAPPGAPRASGHDRLVRLAWQPTQARPGMDIIGYNVYRRRDQGPFPPEPVNRAPLTETRYEDFGLENGTAYHYALRTVGRIEGLEVESPLSAVAQTVPQSGQ